MNIFKKIILFFLIIFIIPNGSFALSSDKQKPADLASDSATLNHKTGISIYRGNVKLTQGTTVVTGNLLTAYTDHHNNLTKITATGTTQQLASYYTLPDNSKLPFTAIALTINYYPPQAHVEFIGQAKATQGRDTFTGPQLNYDMNNKIVTSPSSPEGHTTIIIQPNQKQN
jgi:lipopolysaccharide export system protein LptA